MTGTKLEGVCEARTRLLTGSTFADVCRNTVEGVGEFVEFDTCEFVSEDAGEFVLEARSGGATTATEPSISRTLTERTYRSGEPLLIGDVSRGDQSNVETEYRSVLAVPVATGGVLQLGDRTPDAFDEQTLALVDVFGSYAGDVLEDVSSESDQSQPRSRPPPERTRETDRETYLALVEQFPNGLVTLFDEELRYQLVGGTGLESLELSAGDLEGRRLDDVFPDDNVAALEPLYRRAFDGESSVTELTLEGQVFRVRVVPVRDDHGDVVAGMTISQDITERKRIEEELRAHETHLQQAQDVANLGSWSLDIAEDDLHWSEKCYQIFGIPRDESLSYDQFLERVHPDDRTTVDEKWSGALEGESYDIEHRIVVDGETKWVREKAEIKLDGSGEPRKGVGIVQDITEHKEREQELEAARERYRTLLEAIPDPVFVGNPETGEIVEVNAAAERFRGQPREEIVGIHQTELHPADGSDAYRDLFAEHVAEGGTKRRLSDGSQVYAVTGDGEEVPVEISVATAELGDESVIVGVFRGVGDRLTYERMLTDLNEGTRDLFAAETPTEVGQHVVETVTATLDLTGAVVYRVDERDGTLRPLAWSAPSEIEDEIGSPPVFAPGESVAWRVFSEGESVLFDDVRTADDVHNPQTPFRSEIIVPLGEQGVLVVSDTRTGAFDQQSRNLVEILGGTAEAALERVEREQEMRAREQELESRTSQLEHTESINSRIRDVMRAIVGSKTRQEIEQTVCTQLAASDSFDLVWLGSADPVTDRLTPRARAGDDWGYLEQVDLSLDSGAEPAVETARSHEPIVVENTATDITRANWCREAVRRDVQSVMSVPLVYEGTTQGVLAFYATEKSAFSGVLQPVLLELGELIAHAIVAVERKQALLSNQTTELDFTIQDQGCFFLRFAQITNSEFELTGIIPKSDDTSLAFVKMLDGSSDLLLAEAEQAPEIESARLIEADDEPLLQLRIAEPFIASVLADHGITLRNVSADSTGCRATVAVPPTFDVNRVVDVVSSIYPESDVLAKREQSEYPESAGTFGEQVLGRLTDRQLEVAETAYLSGYFESPRRTNGEELAEKLEFSTSAFHHHVRAAERKLFEVLFENTTTLSSTRPSEQDSG